MSFDIVLSLKQAQENFSSFFSAQPNWNCSQTNFCYENPDTGVAWTGEYDSQQIVIHLNYLRPLYWADEAIAELQKFRREHDFSIKTDTTEENEFNAERLKQSYRTSAKNTLVSLLQENPNRLKISHLPEAYLKKIWEWNYSRETAMNAAANHGNNFYPAIHMAVNQDRLTTFFIINPEINLVLPSAEYVLIDRTALNSTLGKLFKKELKTAIISQEKFTTEFQSWITAEHRLPIMELSTAARKEFIRKIKNLTEEFNPGRFKLVQPGPEFLLVDSELLQD